MGVAAALMFRIVCPNSVYIAHPGDFPDVIVQTTVNKLRSRAACEVGDPADQRKQIALATFGNGFTETGRRLVIKT
jgi:hypothetical protein